MNFFLKVIQFGISLFAIISSCSKNSILLYDEHADIPKPAKTKNKTRKKIALIISIPPYIFYHITNPQKVKLSFCKEKENA